MSSSEQPKTVEKQVQVRPLFSTDAVEYMHITTEDGHLFICDKEAVHRSSGTLKVMIEAQSALNSVGEESKPIVSIPIQGGHSSPAVAGCLEFLLWRKRWINVVIDKIIDWVAPTDQLLVQEMADASDFFDL